MRRIAAGSLVACAAAMIIAACGGSSPMTPTPPPSGGGGGGGGGVVTNTPPQIKSIAVSDTRVEAGAPVTLTATVEDAETPVANLLFAWTTPAGSVAATGNGSTIAFTPGTDLQTPADYDLTLTVTERYTSGGVQLENKATGSVTLHVNNSPKELADLSVRFLNNFATSSVSPAQCVSEFSDSCRGKKDELADIDDNRHDFLILASTVRHTGLELASNKLTAKVHTFCSFTSRVITTQPRDEACLNGACPLNSVGTAQGDCWTTNVYENGRWWLCESHFTGAAPLNAFTRAFFGIKRQELP